MDTKQAHRSSTKPLLVITGGGTAGHVYPALALVDELKTKYRFQWIGSTRGIERRILGDTRIPYRGIATGKLRRNNTLRFAIDIFKILLGFLESLYILLRSRPSVIFSKGGYVSVPVVLAGYVLGIPVVSHESDTSFGLATRINSRFSVKTCVSWRHGKSAAANNKIVYTGSPVRQEFFTQSNTDTKSTPSRHPIIVFLSGSLGSLEINKLVMDLIDDLAFCEQVYHHHGSSWHPTKTAQNYVPLERYGLDFVRVLHRADLIVSRAGAATLSELAAIGKPAILIPLKNAVSRGEQVANARYMQSVGAAEMLVHPDAKALYTVICDILHDSNKYNSMGKMMQGCATPNAARRIAEMIQTADTLKRVSIRRGNETI